MEINDSNYNDVLAQNKPMVLDFWATWCGPCRKVGPTIQELAEEYEGQVIVGKVNIEEEADDLIAEFGIRNVPTILFLKGGQVVDKVGFRAVVCSNVLPGSGLSSSAAFEVLIGNVINGLFFLHSSPVRRFIAMFLTVL